MSLFDIESMYDFISFEREQIDWRTVISVDEKAAGSLAEAII